MRLLALALLLPLPALADCADPQTQVEMTTCSGAAFKAADTELNAAYKAAMATMKAWDADLDPADQGAAEALRDAQRAWIPYRDAACGAEGFFYLGGSMESMVVTDCLTRLTRERTAALAVLTESSGE